MTHSLLRHPILCGALALTGGLYAQSSLAQAIDHRFGDGIRIDQKLDTQVPLDLSFVNSVGQTVQLADLLLGRPAILNLVYYECPMLCTQVLNGLLRSIKVLSLDVASDYDIITVSIDPTETSALAKAKKKEYVGRYRRDGAENGWHFLTGTQDQITRLADAVGFRYEFDKETDNYAHASGIMVLTPEGRLARYFYGIDYAPKNLRLGLIEASQNNIGNPVDQLLLLCFQYDPSTGQYSLAVFNTVRVAGAITVAVLVSFVVLMLRRDRRSRRVAMARLASNAVPTVPNQN